jgi:hypothetical protein
MMIPTKAAVVSKLATVTCHSSKTPSLREVASCRGDGKDPDREAIPLQETVVQPSFPSQHSLWCATSHLPHFTTSSCGLITAWQ